jgi:hypothetical protein
MIINLNFPFIEEPISTFDSIQAVEREEAKGPTSAMIKFRLAGIEGRSCTNLYLFFFILMQRIN